MAYTVIIIMVFKTQKCRKRLPFELDRLYYFLNGLMKVKLLQKSIEPIR